MNPINFDTKRQEFASLCKSGCPVHTYAHTYPGPNPVTFYYTDEISKLEAYQDTQPTFRLGFTSLHGTHIPTLLNLETLDTQPTHYTLVGATPDTACAFIGYTPAQASALAKALGFTQMPYSVPLNTLDTLKHFDALNPDVFTLQLSKAQANKASELFKSTQPHPITPQLPSQVCPQETVARLLKRDAYTEATIRQGKAKHMKGGNTWDF